MATVATSWPAEAHQRVPTAAGSVGYTEPQQAEHHASYSSSSSRHTSAAYSSRKSSRHQNDQYYDRFYGHRELAELCERVILALFACPLDSTSSSASPSSSASKPAPRLSEFIAYALHRTRLPLAVTQQALFLLKRLKSRYPAARGSSGHRLFISALMLASKSSCDDTYSNKSWTIVGQGLFSLREVNQMERELFAYLGFRVNVEPEDLEEFVIGLQHGRIHAPTEPISPAMGVASHFESTDGSSSHQAASSSSSSLSPSPCAPAVSPSAVSEPCFETSAASETASSAGPHRYSRPRHHTTNSSFNNRASIAGYPSSQPMVSSSSVPMAASLSDPALKGTLSNGMYDAQASSSHSTDAHHESRAAYSHHAALAAPAPSVPMQGYFPASPSAASLSSSSRGSLSAGSSSDVSSYVPSPFASQASSSNTTPETPASDFDSPGWDAPGSLDVMAAYGAEHPAGTYDKEHQAFSKHATRHQYQAPASHHALAQATKAPTLRYHQQPTAHHLQPSAYGSWT